MALIKLGTKGDSSLLFCLPGAETGTPWFEMLVILGLRRPGLDMLRYHHTAIMTHGHSDTLHAPTEIPSKRPASQTNQLFLGSGPLLDASENRSNKQTTLYCGNFDLETVNNYIYRHIYIYISLSFHGIYFCILLKYRKICLFLCTTLRYKPFKGCLL